MLRVSHIGSETDEIIDQFLEIIRSGGFVESCWGKIEGMVTRFERVFRIRILSMDKSIQILLSGFETQP